ncbi:hypothetical protein PV356_17380 [Streptomyces sp. WI03-5b]|uniref:hypothetical protein n=1 Tax=Streptomyces sp. WI03-5b TaxID=462946 RepID=UPI0029A513B1|nr:hypothetical protein [Streptomyces sp. WI03-5b]MDX2621280.1 hypothetical protein [Streptomyces sp. WI03-5b]
MLRMAVELRVLRRDDILLAATSAGFSVMTERRLEDFRRDGLMPRPVRVGNDGRRPVWIYPPGSDRQLVQLLRWRKHTSNVNVLRVVLWIEGFPLALDVVRASATAVMDGLSHELEQLLQTEASSRDLDPADDQDAVVDAVAETMAAKRGKDALPRPIRVPAGKRATAVAQLLRIFAVGTQPNVTEDEAETVEKVLGVSPGRRHRVEDAGPWLTGPASVLVGAADFVSLPRMTEALTDATDTEWEEARSSAAAFFLQLPVFSRAVAAMTGNKNFAGMGGHTALDSEPLMAVLLMAFVLGARGADWFGNVEDLAATLARWPTLVGEMKQVLDLPQAELDRNLAGLSHEMRARTQRIIQALLDGELDTGPKPVR